MKSAYNQIIKYELANHISTHPDVYLDGSGIVRKHFYGNGIPQLARQYNPDDVPSIHKILLCEKARVKICIGPYNSGKSSAVMQAILRDAVEMPKCDDGVRRSKIALIRNTAGDLETTTLQTWLFWTHAVLPPPKRSKKPILKYDYSFSDEKGEIELTVIFLGLDRPDDFNKLASLELTSAYINELQFVPRTIFEHLQARVGRYPAKVEFMKKFDAERANKKSYREEYANWFPYTKHVYADTNAPETDHWIVEQIEKKKLKHIKVYHQPEGLYQDEHKKWHKNLDADNLANQDPDYYMDMLQHGEEYARVYACGKYGTVCDGKPVFSNYNDDWHSKPRIEISEYDPIMLGVDYGMVSPAVLLCQFVKGQLRALKEFVCEDRMTVKDLCRSSVIPYINRHHKEQTCSEVDDPANTGQGREDLQELGFDPDPAATNKIETRVKTVNNLMNESSAGQPRFLLSREGCPKLREACIGKYHFRRLRVVGEERFQDVPEKNHPFSDIADCLEYVAMEVEGIESIKREETGDYRQAILRKYAEDTRDEWTGY